MPILDKLCWLWAGWNMYINALILQKNFANDITILITHSVVFRSSKSTIFLLHFKPLFLIYESVKTLNYSLLLNESNLSNLQRWEKKMLSRFSFHYKCKWKFSKKKTRAGKILIDRREKNRNTFRILRCVTKHCIA